MQELLLVGNPARRKARKTRKAPSAAQKRARAAFAAMARARRNPAKRKTTKRRAAPVTAIAKRRVTRRAARRNPARRTSAPKFSHSIMPRLKMAMIGGAGAFGVDVAFGYAQTYLPDSVKSPSDATGGINFLYYAAKGAVAIGVGMIAQKLGKGSLGATIANSSLTVTAHDLIKQFAAANLSSVPVGRVGMRGMPGGRVLPPLPQMQSLRRYSGSTSDQVYTGATSALRAYPSSLRAYPSAAARENLGNR